MASSSDSDRRTRASRFGPALVLALSAIGPFDLVSNAAAGSGYGYRLLWTLTLIFLARYVTLEASARYVLATGESLVTGFARIGRWALWLILLATALKLFFGNLSLILLLGSASDALFRTSFPGSSALWAALFWAAGFALMYHGRYELTERCAKPFLALLGLSIGAIALLARPDLTDALRGGVIPSVPPDEGAYRYGLVLMAVIGSSAGSLSNLQYAGFVHEKGWRMESFLREQRRDLLVGIVSMWMVAMLIQIAAAAAFHDAGAEFRTPADFIDACTRILGPAGRWAAAIGLWAAVFTTFIAANTGYSMVVADIWRMLRSTAETSTAQGPLFRWALAAFCLPPVYALFTDWKPLPLVLLSTAIFVVVLPVSVALLLRLTADRRIMGPLANRWLSNAVLTAILIAAIVLTWQNLHQAL